MKQQLMTSWWWDDVTIMMIAATLHWLLLAMWHANHLINSNVIGKSENQYLPKKHETRFYEWNGAFRTFGQIRVMSFRYPRWNPCTPSMHLMSPFGKYRHQLFIFVSWIPMILISCQSSQCIESAISTRLVLSKGRSGNRNLIRDRVTDLLS